MKHFRKVAIDKASELEKQKSERRKQSEIRMKIATAEDQESRKKWVKQQVIVQTYHVESELIALENVGAWARQTSNKFKDTMKNFATLQHNSHNWGITLETGSPRTSVRREMLPKAIKIVALVAANSTATCLEDLSAAFDTVDHAILISRLSNRFGVKGTALAWFKSYLTSRKQFVKVEEGLSSNGPLLRGVPQGSVLGPLLYLIYTAPIADIIKQHNLLYHLYADDTQLYISFKTDCCVDLEEAKSRVERCVEEIDRWMCNNLLKLNQDKTELVVISSKFRHCPDLKHIRVGDEYIAPKSSARNLGVIIDNCLCMEQHV
ncbi:hypothetical protein ACROYT_G014703 [Oculina patagonica]